MAVIAGMETAKVDDVTPIGLPIEQMAKGIMAVQARADDNKNAIEQFNKDLNMELRDREEDWDTFREVKNNMYDEMKKLEESVGGDWSKVDKSAVSSIAMKAAQSDEVRQLKTALENVKIFEQQQKAIEAAGSTPYHFGIDPRNASLRNPDGSWRDMRDYEVYKNPDATKDIDELSDKLGDVARKSSKFDAHHKHMSQAQRDELWYHLWTKTQIDEVSNLGNVNTVIEEAYNQAMAKASVKLEHRKLQQDYLRSNPDATEQQAAEYARQTIRQMIFGSSKRKLKMKYEEDITPYFQTKPMAPAGGGGSPRGSGSGSDVKIPNSFVQTVTITNDGTETIGMPTYADAHNFITSRDVNITQLGKPVSEISISGIENINMLEQYALGVPQLAGPDGSNTLGFDGSFFSITQRKISASSADIPEERWSDNPAIMAVDRRKAQDVDKFMSTYLVVDNDAGSTLRVAEALFSTDYGDVEGVDVAGMSLALFTSYVDEFKSKGMSSLEARNAAKALVEQKMASYTSFNANSKYASPYEMRSKEDGTYEIGVHEGSTTLMQFYDNLLETTTFFKTENGKQVPRSEEEVAKFKEGVRKKRDYLQTRISKAEELSRDTEFTRVSEAIINRRAMLDNKAAEFASRDYMMRLNAGMGENDFFTTGITVKGKDEDQRVATAEYLSSSVAALYQSLDPATFNYGLTHQGSIEERSKAYKTIMKERPDLAKIVSTNLDLALSGRLNIPDNLNEVIGAKIAKGTGPLQTKVEKYFNPSAVANGVITSFASSLTGVLTGQALSNAVSAFKTMNSTADSFYVDLTREQMKAHLSPTDREILEGLTTGSYTLNAGKFILNATTGAGLISDAVKYVAPGKVNELLFTYQEMLKINYATAGVKGDDTGAYAGFGVNNWRLGQSEANKNLVKAIETNQLNVGEHVRNKVMSTSGFRGTFNEKFNENLTKSNLLTPAAKKYFAETRSSKEGYEMSVPVHWVTDETEGGKAIHKWAQEGIKNHFTSFGKSDGSLHAAIYGAGKEELQNRQVLVDIWNAKSEGKLTDKPFHEWIAENASVKGLAFDVDHNGNSSNTLVINFSGLGPEGALVGDIQVPVLLEGAGANMLHALGWPSEISKYGKEARETYRESGGNWIDLKSGGKTVRYHRAPTNLVGFGVGGTTIEKGEYFIVGDGNPDYAIGAAQGKAQKIGHPVAVMKHYESAIVGPELEQMKKYQQLFHQGMNARNPDAFFQAHLGKGMTAKKFIDLYNSKFLTGRTTSTGGTEVKK